MIETTINGNKVKLFKVGELARYCKRTPDYFRQLTTRGVLPRPNWRTPARVVLNVRGEEVKVNGDALYSADFLAPKLREVFKFMRKGKKFHKSQLEDIANAFAEEKKYYSPKK